MVKIQRALSQDLCERIAFTFLGLLVTAAGTTHAATSAFSHAVNNGAMAVSIPIAVPPGTAGMQPVLGFSYSQGAHGAFLGEGWALQGFATITRCASTQATERRVQNERDSQSYCLDGQKLIPVTYPLPTGADVKIEFRTEIDSLSRIVAFRKPGEGSSSGEIVGWREWRKDGVVRDFGEPDAASYTRSSAKGVRLELNQSKPAIWLLARHSDTYRNAIEYFYSSNSDLSQGAPAMANQVYSARPIRIEYGGQYDATGASKLSEHYASVNFYYTDYQQVTDGELLRDRVSFSHSGVLVRKSGYLSRVVTATQQFGTTTWLPAKEYQVSYLTGAEFLGQESYNNQIGYKKFVKEIAECVPTINFASTAGTCIKSAQQAHPFGETGSQVARPVQFEYFVRGSGFGENAVFGAGDMLRETRFRYLKSAGTAIGATFGRIRYVDVNGDGIPDACWHHGDTTNSGKDQLSCRFGKKGNGNNPNIMGFEESASTVVLSSPFIGFVHTVQCCTATLGLIDWIDVDNDGRVDACFLFESNARENTSLSDRHQIVCLRNITASGSTQLTLGATPMYPVAKPTGSSVIWSRGYTSNPWILLGDANGDGKADFCSLASSDPGNSLLNALKQVNCWLSQAHTEEKLIVSLSSIDPVGEHVVRALDVNRDGLTDICYVPKASSPNFQLNCHLMHDRGTFDTSGQPRFYYETSASHVTTNSIVVSMFLEVSGYSNIALVDSNADGFVDICGLKAEYMECVANDGQKFAFWSSMLVGVLPLDPLNRFIVDVNGDGRADYCGFRDDGTAQNHENTFKCIPNIPRAKYTTGVVNPSTPWVTTPSVWMDSIALGAGTPHIIVFPSTPKPGAVDTVADSGSAGFRTFALVGNRHFPSFCRQLRADANQIVCDSFSANHLGLLKKITAGPRSVDISYAHLPTYPRYRPGTLSPPITVSGTWSTTRNTSAPGACFDPANEARTYCYPIVPVTQPGLVVATIKESATPTPSAEQTFGQVVSEYGYGDMAMDLRDGRNSVSLGEMSVEVTDPDKTLRTITRTAQVWPFTGAVVQGETRHIDAFGVARLISRTKSQIGRSQFSSCAISNPDLSGQKPWPIIVIPGKVFTTNWHLSSASGQILQVPGLPTMNTTKDIEMWDACANPTRIKTEYLDANNAPTGKSQLVTSTYKDVLTTNTYGISSRWLLARAGRIEQTDIAPVASAPTPVLMPAAGVGLLPLTPPSPLPSSTNVYLVPVLLLMM